MVHWKEDHYAAIVELKSGFYKVLDPTFGDIRWLKPEEIQEETTGYFMVPRAKLPASWRVVPASETDRIFGRGIAISIADRDDGCGNGSGGSNPAGSKGKPILCIREAPTVAVGQTALGR